MTGPGQSRLNGPSIPEVPADPLDAVLRLTAESRTTVDMIRTALRDALVEVATDVAGRPVVETAPDGSPCLPVVTSAPQRALVEAPAWSRVDLTELVMLLPDGIDVLFNPGGPVPVRLTGNFVRQTLFLIDDEGDI